MFTTDVIVFGASRGIGLGFTLQYLEAGRTVIATYRGKQVPDTLLELQKVHKGLLVYSLDITEEAKVIEFAAKVQGVKILLLNAGVKGSSASWVLPNQTSQFELEEALKVNVLAHNSIMQAFFSHLLSEKDSIAVYMGSKVGLPSDNALGGAHPYRISKAAAHMMICNWDKLLQQKWKEAHPNDTAHTPCAFALCAGWVKTDMGGSNARLSVEECVFQMRQVIETVLSTKASNGLYMYDGSVIDRYPSGR